MALPILNTATYELTLPSSDVKVKYRPFLVKEEKILLMAMEADNAKEITRSLKEICHACTFGAINVAALPTFDLEYIFLNIRSKSVGEVAKLRLLCPDDKKTYSSVEVDLTKVEVQVDDAHTNVVQVNKDVKLIMKYPTIDMFETDKDATEMKTDQLFDVIAGSIHEIYEGETVHKGADYSKKEMNDFIDTLTSETFNKIHEFFNTMPKLQHEVEIENPKTKIKSKVMLVGLQSFFVSPSATTT